MKRFIVAMIVERNQSSVWKITKTIVLPSLMNVTFMKKSFRNRNMLEHHQVCHANKKEFECNECGKRFNIKSDLNVHQRIDIGEKNFHCKDCGKSFLGSSQLKNHQYVHSEAREFLCHCGKGFKTSYALKKKTFHSSQRCKGL